MSRPLIAASILSADFGKLAEDTQSVVDAGVDYIHFDVMDFHFVPNLSFGPFICQTLRRHGITTPIDTHLMVTNPDVYVEPFAKAGANLISFHAEVVRNPIPLIQKIKHNGMEAGIVFNPDTSLDILYHQDIMEHLDMILIMSVHPGFSGQPFIHSALEKISTARQIINTAKSCAYLAVDGGIKLHNIKQAVQAGADFIVLGSGIFGTSCYSDTIAALRKQTNRYLI
jgi:ribulose-phosphate 3-epimerase